MKTNISNITRKFLMLLMSFVLVGGFFALPIHSFAGQTFQADQYSYGELTTGDDGGDFGWDEGVLVDATGVDEATDLESGGNALVNKVNDFSVTFGFIATLAYVLICLARFAGRGIYELAFSHSEGAEVPFLLKTSEERGGSRGGRSGRGGNSDGGWVVPMIKETLVFGLIIIGVWVIIGVMIGIVHLFFSEAVDPIQDQTGTTQFSIGGITIDL